MRKRSRIRLGRRRSESTRAATAVKEGRAMIRLVAFIAIGVMGLILVRVRRQRKARLAEAPRA